MRGELRDELLREALLLVPALRVRSDLGAREVADGLAQEPVVLGEIEVHGQGALGRLSPS